MIFETVISERIIKRHIFVINRTIVTLFIVRDPLNIFHVYLPAGRFLVGRNVEGFRKFCHIFDRHNFDTSENRLVR